MTGDAGVRMRRGGPHALRWRILAARSNAQRRHQKKLAMRATRKTNAPPMTDSPIMNAERREERGTCTRWCNSKNERGWTVEALERTGCPAEEDTMRSVHKRLSRAIPDGPFPFVALRVEVYNGALLAPSKRPKGGHKERRRGALSEHHLQRVEGSEMHSEQVLCSRQSARGVNPSPSSARAIRASRAERISLLQPCGPFF